MRGYPIDSKHGNCLTLPGSPGGLEMVEERTQPGGTELRLSANMEPMALCLWTVEREPRSATTQGNGE